MVASALERRGYKVIAVRSGEEALAAIDRHGSEIGVLLTDVVMPGIGGLELIEQARRRRPDLRAICTSGYTPLKLNHGPIPDDVSFFEKPFTLTRLDEVIREVLGD
jgi:two-component system cell cycle sensor histidine kinase/response regulator CckA